MLEMLGTNVLVKKGQETESKMGSIVIAPTSEGQLITVSVVGVGPGGYSASGDFRKIEDVAVGDEVVVDRSVTVPVNVDGEEHLVVRYADIIAKQKK